MGSLWLVDPPQRTVEVLRLEGTGWVVAGNFGGEEQARVPPFEAIELELAALWEAPAETPPGDPGP